MNLATANEYVQGIVRLRAEVARLRLTDAEREALKGAIEVLEQEDQWHAAGEARIKTLRGLLERHRDTGSENRT